MKFRMHRSFLALWPECATRSNLRACEKGRTTRRIKRSSTTEEYLLRAGAMMSTSERVNAAECHSIALLEVYCSGDVAESFSWTVGAVKAPLFCPYTSPFDSP